FAPFRLQPGRTATDSPLAKLNSAMSSALPFACSESFAPFLPFRERQTYDATGRMETRRAESRRIAAGCADVSTQSASATACLQVTSAFPVSETPETCVR